jgi:hypothetical protein
MTAYVGGAYEVEFGKAYIGYCEWASTYYTDVLDSATNSGTWWNYAAASSAYDLSTTMSSRANPTNCWTDSTYTTEVID